MSVYDASEKKEKKRKRNRCLSYGNGVVAIARELEDRS